MTSENQVSGSFQNSNSQNYFKEFEGETARQKQKTKSKGKSKKIKVSLDLDKKVFDFYFKIFSKITRENLENNQEPITFDELINEVLKNAKMLSK